MHISALRDTLLLYSTDLHHGHIWLPQHGETTALSAITTVRGSTTLSTLMRRERLIMLRIPLERLHQILTPHTLRHARALAILPRILRVRRANQATAEIAADAARTLLPLPHRDEVACHDLVVHAAIAALVDGAEDDVADGLAVERGEVVDLGSVGGRVGVGGWWVSEWVEIEGG